MSLASSMPESTSQICFYVPSPDIVAGVPRSIGDYWGWIDGAVKRAPANLANGKGPCTWLGPYNWTIQTYLYLKEAGVRCDLTAMLPERGVIVAHGDFLPPALRPTRDQFIVEIKPDRPLQCRHANFVIVQNRHDPLRQGWARALVPSAFVNYWPQPGLLPRDVSRGDRFENVCFMGNSEQFLAETDVLETKVRKLGLSWWMPPRHQWHNYSTVDAIVAVRPLATLASLSTDVVSFFTPERKPASKLYNAWLAGVPAILSPEVGFQSLRRSELDYLEASTIPDIVAALDKLKQNPDLRRAMAENGRRRAVPFAPTQTAAAWRALIDRQILPAFGRWHRSSLRRQWLFVARRLLGRVAPQG